MFKGILELPDLRYFHEPWKELSPPRFGDWLNLWHIIWVWLYAYDIFVPNPITSCNSCKQHPDPRIACQIKLNITFQMLVHSIILIRPHGPVMSCNDREYSFFYQIIFLIFLLYQLESLSKPFTTEILVCAILFSCLPIWFFLYMIVC